MRNILKAKLTYFYVTQIVSDNLHLKCYEICLKTTNGPTPPPSRTKRSVPAGCKFLLEPMHMIGVSNKKTFEVPFQWTDGCLP